MTASIRAASLAVGRASRNHLPQARAFDQGHGDEGNPLSLAALEHWHDVRMVQGRAQGRAFKEAVELDVGRGVRLPHDLQRDDAIVAPPTGPVDVAAGAPADAAQQLMVGEGGLGRSQGDLQQQAGRRVASRSDGSGEGIEEVSDLVIDLTGPGDGLAYLLAQVSAIPRFQTLLHPAALDPQVGPPFVRASGTARRQ
jgi:hypothetical protein